MGTVIVCAILVLICIYSVRSYSKKLRSGCCGAGGDEVKRIKPADKEVSHYPYRYHLEIEGMTCKNCANRVANAFNEKNGYYANVDLKKQTADVYSKESVDEDTLKLIVKRSGYRAASIKKNINVQ